MNTYDLGDRVTLQHKVYSNGALTNATVALEVTAPDGTATTPTVTASATGIYNAQYVTTQAGLHAFVWSVSGAVPDDEVPGQFTVVAVAPLSYCGLATVKTALGITTDTTRDGLILDAINAASRFIDRMTGRQFYAETVATARVYRVRGRIQVDQDGSKIFVDDIATAAGLVVELGTAQSSTYTAVTDYETGPDNALARLHPIEWLLRPAWGFSPYSRVRVTARWGWPAIPDEISEAAKIQASRLFRRKDSPEGVAGGAEWGAIRLTRLDPDVEALVRPFVLPPIA